VVQRADGSFAVSQKPPKKGHYTLVDMTKPLADQVVFVKQASPTVEEAFDYGEKQRRSEKHLSELDRYKKRAEAKGETFAALRDEIYDYIQKNVPTTEQSKFMSLTRAVQPKQRTKTTQKDLVKAIAKTEELLRKSDLKSAIGDLTEAWKAAKKKYKWGKHQFGKLPQDLAKSLQSLMAGIDEARLSEKKRGQLESLQGYIRDLVTKVRDGLLTEAEATDRIWSIPESGLQKLNRLGKTPMRDMTAADIRTITQEMQRLIHQYETKQELLGRRRGRKWATSKATALSQIWGQKGREAGDLSQPGFLRRQFTTDASHIETLVEATTTADESVAKDLLYTDVQEGNRATAHVMRTGDKLIQEHLKSIGWTNTDVDRMKETRAVSIGGESYDLTGQEILSLVMTGRDTDGQSLFDPQLEGFQIGDLWIDHPFSSMTEVLALEDALSNKELAFGEAFAKTNLVVRPEVNAASNDLAGFDIAINDNYYPNHRVRPKRVGGEVETASSEAVEQRGVWQPRTGGKQALRIKPFDVELFTMLENAAVYAGEAVPMRNARTLLQDKEWQQAMRLAGNGAHLDSLITQFRRIQSYPTAADVVDSFAKGRLSKFAQGVLSLRVKTMGVQFGSVPMFFAEMDSKYTRNLRVSPERLAKLLEHSDILWERWKMGRVNIELGNIAAVHATELFLYGRSNFRDKMLRLLTASDKQAIGLAPAAVEAETRDLHPELVVDSDAYWDHVARRTEYLVRHGQPNYNVLDRSNQTSNPSTVSRLIFMFRTALEAQYNVALRADYRYAKSAKTLADKQRWAKAHAAVMASAVSVAAWRIAAAWALKTGAVAALVALGVIDPTDEEAESYTETAKRLSRDSVYNLLAVLPGGTTIMPFVRYTEERIKAEITGDREPQWWWVKYENPFAQMATDSAKVIDHYTEAIGNLGDRGDDEKARNEFIKGTDQLLGVLGRVFGYPYIAPRAEIVRPIERAIKED